MTTTYALSFETFIMLVALVLLVAWCFTWARPEQIGAEHFKTDRERGYEYAASVLETASGAQEAIARLRAQVQQNRYGGPVAQPLGEFDAGILDACLQHGLQ